MKEAIRKDILDILRDSIKALKRENVADLRELSDHTIHCSTIYQEEDATSIAVIIYSLFKIYEKQKFQKSPGWQLFNKDIMKYLDSAYNALIIADIPKYHECIKKLFDIISKFEKAFGLFVTKVIEQSKIKKGSKLMEHGISTGRTAEMLGLSSWDLMNYIGITNVPELQPKTVSVKERLKVTERLFK